MSTPPLKITRLLLIAAALIIGGAFIGRQGPNEGSETKDRGEKFCATTRFQINRTPMVSPVNWLETEIKTITARETLVIAAKMEKLDSAWNLSLDQAASRLERMIEVEQERGTEIIALRAWSDDSEQASAIANAVRRAYEERRAALEEKRSSELAEAIKSQIKTQAQAVEKARLEMLELMKKHAIKGLEVPPLDPASPPERE